jgi:precorrin-4 methylase
MRQPDRVMNWHLTIPRKASLALLFRVAKRRLTEQTDDVAELPNARIITATRELNQITNDIRGAQAPEPAPSAIPRKSSLVVNTVGKILRRRPR